MKFILLLGRILFAAIFLLFGSRLFMHASVVYAASQHVPLPRIAVPIAGIFAILGGLSILLGYKAKVGAWLLVIFLVPVTFMMHNFWAVKDAMAAQNQLVHFMKNLAMLGGALLIAYFGPGPLSLDRPNASK
jgi:putative oxidoreductase